jgi:hypothetical protein
MAELKISAQQEAKVIQHRLKFLLKSKGHLGDKPAEAAAQRTGVHLTRQCVDPFCSGSAADDRKAPSSAPLRCKTTVHEKASCKPLQDCALMLLEGGAVCRCAADAACARSAWRKTTTCERRGEASYYLPRAGYSFWHTRSWAGGNAVPM